MKTRRLTGTTLELSEIGFGCARLASLSTTATPLEIRHTILRALESGINLFDMADSYGQGQCEEILGAALAGQRQRAVIATKAGYRLSATGSAGSRLKPLLRPLFK